MQLLTVAVSLVRNLAPIFSLIFKMGFNKCCYQRPYLSPNTLELSLTQGPSIDAHNLHHSLQELAFTVPLIPVYLRSKLLQSYIL